MRIGDAIASSSNKSTSVKQPQKVPSSSSQKNQIKNQSNGNHGTQPKTQKTSTKISKGSILAQRHQSDGSVQFLFQEDSISQPKWETKEKILSQYPRIVEKFEKQHVKKQSNSGSKKEEEDCKINGKRKQQGSEGEEVASQLNQQSGTKKHCTEERKEQRKDESDIEEVTIQINRNSTEQERKETNKVNLIELFRDLKDSDDDNDQENEDSCDEHTKEEAKEIANTSEKSKIIEENSDNLHIDEENQDQFKSPVKKAETVNSLLSKQSPGEFQKPGMEELVKSAQKKINESVEKIKKSVEKSRLDILNEFKFVKNETPVIQEDKQGNYERKTSESSAADAFEKQNKPEELLQNEETAENLTSVRPAQEDEKEQVQQAQDLPNEHSQSQKRKQPSQTKGDFKLGDKVKRISSCQRKDGVLMMEVEWMPREDGIIPKKSAVPSSLFREYDTAKLLDFYESKLSFPDKKNSSQLKKN